MWLCNIDGLPLSRRGWDIWVWFVKTKVKIAQWWRKKWWKNTKAKKNTLCASLWYWWPPPLQEKEEQVRNPSHRILYSSPENDKPGVIWDGNSDIFRSIPPIMTAIIPSYHSIPSFHLWNTFFLLKWKSLPPIPLFPCSSSPPLPKASSKRPTWVQKVLSQKN